MDRLKNLAKTFAAASALAVAAACSTTGAATDPMPAAGAQIVRAERPNILFIQIDDLRPDLGIYGHPIAQTPHLDALGRSGIVFENAITQQAVCGPSRAALMTGLRPDTSGITDLKTSVDQALPDTVTVLDLFKSNGYQTLGYGKIYHHHDDDADGWTKRTENFELTMRREARRNGEPRLAAVRVDDRDAIADTRNVKMAIDDLRQLGQLGEPFFMAVGIHKPHLPFVAPQSDWDRYDPADIPGPVNPDGQQDAPPWAVVAYEVWNYDDTEAYNETKVMPEAKAKELRHAYLAAISYADSLVGDLMRELKAAGLDDNTIVVVWGDHGWKLGDHNGWAKHSNVDLDIRIPLMISAPGTIDAGLRSKAMVETVDVFPTLAELAGLQAPGNLEGVSMTPLFEDPARAWKSAAFAQYGRYARPHGRATGYVVRNQDFRYTAWVLDDGGKVIGQELYDLRTDPTESRNVASEARYAADLSRLEAMRKSGWQAALPSGAR